MKKVIIILAAMEVVSSGCGQSNTKNQSNSKNNLETQSDTSLSDKVNRQEEWNFVINPPNVGLISTTNRISEIPDLLPTGYSMAKDSTLWNDTDEDEGKWKYSHFYAVRKSGKIIFKIYPDENKDEIFSIAVLTPEYIIKDTELRVESTLGTLKKTFSIKTWNHWFDLGLFIFCNGFNGVFEIELEGEGSDDPNLVDLLPDSKKIKTIIVYK